MSQVYSTEPATNGRVVFDTTHGPIDISLWCKECPTTTRTFLQLCLDGFFDNMIWHRCLDNFLIQTGLTRDESMSGTSAEDMDGYLKRSSAVPASAALSSGGDAGLGWERKKLELNPRIRFNHRGQVAMALPLDDDAKGGDAQEVAERNMLRYQFFVTLEEAPFLDAKHVIFGTVSGPTIFNALRIGRTDVDEASGVPTDMKDSPPRIKSVKIDHHPFQDLVVTSDKSIPWKRSLNGSGKGKDGKNIEQSAMEKRRKKRKGKRDLNVLSFGDEERDYEEIVVKSDKKGDGDKNRSKGSSIPSSHDVLAKESKILSSQVDASVEKRVLENDEAHAESKNIEDASTKKRKLDAGPGNTPTKDINEIRNIEAAAAMERAEKSSRERSKREHKKSKEEKQSKRSEPTTSNIMSEVEARRAKYLKRGMGSSAKKAERLRREDDTMKKLLAFKTKVLETKGSKKSSRNGEDGTSAASKKKSVDDSLAARMAKRMEAEEMEEEERNRVKEAMTSAPGYSGQVLDDDDNDEDSVDNAEDSGDWMGTKFKCKRHIDHESRMTALDHIGDATDEKEIGGDGRRMDDYMVIDEKGRARSDGSGAHRHDQKHHHHKSTMHAGRVHRRH